VCPNGQEHRNIRPYKHMGVEHKSIRT